MENIKYVELKLTHDRLGRRATLRDYSIDLKTGKSTVNEDQKIGKPISKNDTVRVIYPAELSEDGKWVKAMNADGACGFIRASRVDLKPANFNETKAKDLKAPYQTFISEDHRIVYEASNNLRSHSKEKVAAAQKSVATYNSEITAAEQLLHDYNDFVDFYNNVPHRNELKPKADPLNGNPLVDDVINFAKAQDMKEPGRIYGQYQIYLDFQKDQKTLQNQNFTCEIDHKNGRIQTDVSPLEAKDMTTVLYRNDKLKFNNLSDLPPSYASCRNATEDFNNVYYGNRIYAEKATMDRMNYKEKAEAAIIQEGFGMDNSLRTPLTPTPEADLISRHVKENGGLLVCENHGNRDAKDWITENMATMKQDGVGVIYIEHLFEGKEQQVIDSFLKSEKGSPMDPALKRFCKADPKRAGFEQLFEAARENDMRIVGIGSSLSQSNTGIDPYERISTFNARAHEIVLDDLISHVEDPNKGYVLLAGGAHMLFHEGKDKNMPLKGLSQTLGAQAVNIENKDGKLVPKPVDTAAVFVPSKNGKASEIVKVDDYKKTLETKAPEAGHTGRKEISVDKLMAEDKPTPKPESKGWVRAEMPKGPRPQNQPLSQRGPQK